MEGSLEIRTNSLLEQMKKHTCFQRLKQKSTPKTFLKHLENTDGFDSLLPTLGSTNHPSSHSSPVHVPQPSQIQVVQRNDPQQEIQKDTSVQPQNFEKLTSPTINMTEANVTTLANEKSFIIEIDLTNSDDDEPVLIEFREISNTQRTSFRIPNGYNSTQICGFNNSTQTQMGSYETQLSCPQVPLHKFKALQRQLIGQTKKLEENIKKLKRGTSLLSYGVSLKKSRTKQGKGRKLLSDQLQDTVSQPLVILPNPFVRCTSDAAANPDFSANPLATIRTRAKKRKKCLERPDCECLCFCSERKLSYEEIKENDYAVNVFPITEATIQNFGLRQELAKVCGVRTHQRQENSRNGA